MAGEPSKSLLWKLLDLLLMSAGGPKRASVGVHEAPLAQGAAECFFINVTNTSPTKDIELTHVWLKTAPEIHIANHARPLPKRLRPDESWETWLPAVAVPKHQRGSIAHMARVRISTGKILSLPAQRRRSSSRIYPGRVT